MEELWMAARQEDARKEKASPQGLLGQVAQKHEGLPVTKGSADSLPVMAVLCRGGWLFMVDANGC